MIEVRVSDVVFTSSYAHTILPTAQKGSINKDVHGQVSDGDFGTGDDLDIVQVFNYIPRVVPL